MSDRGGAAADSADSTPGRAGEIAGRLEYRARGLARSIDLWQQRQTIIAFPWSVYRKFADDSGSRFAAQLAYYALFSIAPLLLVFAVVLGRVLRDDPQTLDRLIDVTLGAFPGVADSVNAAIVTLPDGGLPLLLGVVAALYAGLAFTESAQFAFNQIWAVPWRIRPGFFPRQFRALSMTLLFYSGLVGYGVVAAWSGLAAHQSVAVRTSVLLIAGAIFFGVVLLSYWVLCGRKLTFWQIWPGTLAFLAITMLVIPFLSGLFARLVENASALYGALASVIAVLSLFYTTAVLFILTAEINAVRTWRLWPRALFPDWLSHADRSAYTVLAPVEERMPEQRVITYFGVLSDRFSRELGPQLDHARFDFVDRPPPFILDDPGTVLMDYYAEGREPGVVIEPYSPKPTPPTEEASIEGQG